MRGYTAASFGISTVTLDDNGRGFGRIPIRLASWLTAFYPHAYGLGITFLICFTIELKTAHVYLMSPQQHLHNGLARAADYGIFWDRSYRDPDPDSNPGSLLVEILALAKVCTL